MDFITVWIFVLVGLASLISAYLMALTVAAYRFKSEPVTVAPALSIACVIPAHDEERLLPRTLKALIDSDYPRNLLSIIVIADNCGDSTADLARSMGATVVERKDLVRRGKGFALNDFFVQHKALYEGTDVVTIIDADTVVSRSYFKALSNKFAHSQVQAVQGYYGVLNPESSWLTRIMDAALSVFHHLRPAGRIMLGGSAGLKGNGMAFRTMIIKKYGWPCASLAEDLEMSLFLASEGYKVDYCPEAQVFAEMPLTRRQANSQRQRWEQGRFALARSLVSPLLGKLARTGRMQILDSLLDLLVPPLSILCYLLVFLLVANFLVLENAVVYQLLLANFLTVGFYVASGLVLRRTSYRVWLALAISPIYLFFKIGVYLKLILHRQTDWIRTSRG